MLFLAHTIPMSNRRTHGPAIRAIREALGVTQDNLASSCDVSPSYMSRVEAGIKQPSEELVTAICNRLAIKKDAITYAVPTQELAA